MSVDSLVPCLGLTLGFLILGALIGVCWPFYRNLTQPQPGQSGKLDGLDGLRAYLAIGVFFHHGIVTYYWMTTGNWGIPPLGFYRVVGPLSVGLFFMITGFLFWTKAIRGSASIPAGKLLIGRVLRIGPMYLVVSALIYGTLLVESGFRLQGSPGKLLLAFASPLILGLLKWRSITGVYPGTLNAEVNWTLQYEWVFYLSLPLLAILATPRRFVVLVLLGLVMLPRWIAVPPSSLGYHFLVGMAAAHAVQALGQIRWLSGGIASLVGMALVVFALNVSEPDDRLEKTLVLAALGLFFLIVVNGNTLFGVLTNRGAKVLGTISYSFYLTHGFVLYLGRGFLQRLIGPAPPSTMTFWGLLTVCGVVSIAGSAVTYRYVEHPFIALSHRLGRRLPEARPPGVPEASDQQPAPVGTPG